MTYLFYLKEKKKMNKIFLILLIFIQTNPSWAKTVKPLKSFKTSSVKLSSGYLKQHPRSQLLVQIKPNKDYKSTHSLIIKECKKQKLECYLAFDAEAPELVNINASGETPKLAKILLWFKKNSQNYIEKKHKN
jgi:hypothetical protein